ncbi:PASTA domain-containing protein [Sinomicrobium weinanense]|uniref:PASTA domain-containing protein n=1 Tax=Sinomicrobium weinanense TaxID=2842200 RepID=A0A926JS00_9FLAO|nr:PASTA domain-containing protein [Sinomicrobium weinanense]MBC9796306.1 PASTA domain-containing protein [Sinomicrobium weinanense]MBU3123213.1 PASTA domain-containing protein [Sinomicrobium weinanense]
MSIFRFLASKSFLAQIIIAGMVVIALIILALQWLKITTNHGEFVTVPDLSKKTLNEVKETLDQADLRFEVLDSANFNPSYPRYSVIEQEPTGGSKVKENRKIYLTINPSGYREVSVPNIIQVTRRNAESMLRAVGLEVGRVEYIDEIGKDMVYYIQYQGKKIAPGDQFPKTTKIDLVCGNGGKEEKKEEESGDEGAETEQTNSEDNGGA